MKLILSFILTPFRQQHSIIKTLGRTQIKPSLWEGEIHVVSM